MKMTHEQIGSRPYLSNGCDAPDLLYHIKKSLVYVNL